MPQARSFDGGPLPPSVRTFYHVNDVIVYLGRQRGEGFPIERDYGSFLLC